MYCINWAYLDVYVTLLANLYGHVSLLVSTFGSIHALSYVLNYTMSRGGEEESLEWK